MGSTRTIKQQIIYVFLSGFLLTLFVMAPAQAISQTFRGGINGTLADKSDAAIPDTQVTATDEETGVAHTTMTSKSGGYSFQDLPLGSYTIHVATSGFQPINIKGVTVSAGAIYTLPLHLNVADQLELAQNDLLDPSGRRVRGFLLREHDGSGSRSATDPIRRSSVA